MKTLAACTILVFLATSALAQEKETVQKPSTELEAFLQTKGQIIVKEFHDLGKIPGLYGTGLTLGTLVLYEPGSPSKKRKGMSIEVKSGGRLERENTSFLDVEEIDALSKGIAYMSKLAGEWQGKPREYTEVIFSTKGDLQVGFYTNKGEISAFAKSGHIGVVNAVLSPDSLNLLKASADKGLDYLNNR